MNKTALICFTKKGSHVAFQIKSQIDAVVYATARVNECDIVITDLRNEIAEIFRCYSQIIFICAVGIAVRLIAPNIKDKFTDPAVLVVDEKCKFVISLLSGHMGGANCLAENIAELVGAVPVITTATDLNGKFAVDLFVKKNHLIPGERNIMKEISASVLDEKVIGFWSDYPVTGDRSCFSDDAALGIAVSHKNVRPFQKTLLLKPRNLILGIGCKRGVSFPVLYQTVESILQQHGYGLNEVLQIRTIDRKQNESAIQELASKINAELVFYSAEELQNVEGDFQSSSFVQRIVKVDNVCERSAAFGGCRVLIRKQIRSGITLAVSETCKEIVI